MALHEAPGLGQGHGPLGQQAVRLDTGLGLRLNQVTVTGKDYAKMVDFYRKLGLKQIVDSPENQYARFEAGGATFSIQCDPEAEIGETVAVYFECDDLDERVERLARIGHPVRAWSAQPALDVARGAAARPVGQYHLLLSRRRGPAFPAVADGRIIHKKFQMSCWSATCPVVLLD